MAEKTEAGRPSKYSVVLADRIVDYLMEGASMVKICDLPDMPHRRTVLRWMESDPDFATRCARAREMQADLMDDKISDLIDSVTPENAPAARVKLAALQWRASKLAPKKYGDKLIHAGDAENPMEMRFADMSTDELRSFIAERASALGIGASAGATGAEASRRSPRTKPH